MWQYINGLHSIWLGDLVLVAWTCWLVDCFSFSCVWLQLLLAVEHFSFILCPIFLSAWSGCWLLMLFSFPPLVICFLLLSAFTSRLLPLYGLVNGRFHFPHSYALVQKGVYECFFIFCISLLDTGCLLLDVHGGCLSSANCKGFHWNLNEWYSLDKWVATSSTLLMIGILTSWLSVKLWEVFASPDYTYDT